MNISKPPNRPTLPKTTNFHILDEDTLRPCIIDSPLA